MERRLGKLKNDKIINISNPLELIKVSENKLISARKVSDILGKRPSFGYGLFDIGAIRSGTVNGRRVTTYGELSIFIDKWFSDEFGGLEFNFGGDEYVLSSAYEIKLGEDDADLRDIVDEAIFNKLMAIATDSKTKRKKL